jgi:hypothetical protein
VSEETYKKCIKPDGEFKGKRVGPKDIIRLQGGGTGYAGRDGEKAQVKKHFSLGECPCGVWLGVVYSNIMYDCPGAVIGLASEAAAGLNETSALLLIHNGQYTPCIHAYLCLKKMAPSGSIKGKSADPAGCCRASWGWVEPRLVC